MLFPLQNFAGSPRWCFGCWEGLQHDSIRNKFNDNPYTDSKVGAETGGQTWT